VSQYSVRTSNVLNYFKQYFYFATTTTIIKKTLNFYTLIRINYMFKLERVEVALHVVTFGWTWNSYPVNSICWTSKFPSSPLIYSSVRDSDHTQRIGHDCTCSYGVMASPMMVKCYSCYLEISSRYDCVGSCHGSSLLVADSLNWILVFLYEHWMVSWICFLMI